MLELIISPIIGFILLGTVLLIWEIGAKMTSYELYKSATTSSIYENVEYTSLVLLLEDYDWYRLSEKAEYIFTKSIPAFGIITSDVEKIEFHASQITLTRANVQEKELDRIKLLLSRKDWFALLDYIESNIEERVVEGSFFHEWTSRIMKIGDNNE